MLGKRLGLLSFSFALLASGIALLAGFGTTACGEPVVAPPDEPRSDLCGDQVSTPITLVTGVSICEEDTCGVTGCPSGLECEPSTGACTNVINNGQQTVCGTDQVVCAMNETCKRVSRNVDVCACGTGTRACGPLEVCRAASSTCEALADAGIDGSTDGATTMSDSGTTSDGGDGGSTTGPGVCTGIVQQGSTVTAIISATTFPTFGGDGFVAGTYTLTGVTHFTGSTGTAYTTKATLQLVNADGGAAKFRLREDRTGSATFELAAQTSGAFQGGIGLFQDSAFPTCTVGQANLKFQSLTNGGGVTNVSLEYPAGSKTVLYFTRLN